MHTVHCTVVFRPYKGAKGLSKTKCTVTERITPKRRDLSEKSECKLWGFLGLACSPVYLPNLPFTTCLDPIFMKILKYCVLHV
jgi:hypothetical protein